MTLRYRFRIQHRQGNWHRGSDAVCRNPATAVRAVMQVCLSPASSSDYVRSSTLEAMAEYGDDLGAISPDVIRAAGRADQSYMALSDTIEAGFPGKRNLLNPELWEFWEIRNRLSTDDGLILMDKRIVVPLSHRKRVLRCLHSAHQGVVGMKARALFTGLEWMLQFAISTQAVGIVLPLFLPQVCHVSLWWWLRPQTIFSSRLSWMYVRSNLICTWSVLTDWLDGLWFFIWSLVMPPPWSWSSSARLCFRHMAHRKSWAVMEDPYSCLMHSRVSSRHGECVIACLQQKNIA